MTDVQELKQLIELLKDRVGDVPTGGMLCIDRADVETIIAALEDRDG